MVPAELSSGASRDHVVLVVDDEPEVLSAIRRFFRDESFSIATADNSEAALDLLKTTEIDLIIADERMPIMTGTQLLRKARDCSPGTTRALLTGYPSAAMVGLGFEAGADAFIFKPWDEPTLRDMVRGIMRGKAGEARRADSTPSFDVGGESG
jgi:DNA-binding response OmpR family regulator